MKICLIMCDNRPFSQELYNGKCLAANQIYCEKYNYDLRVFKLQNKFNNRIEGLGCYSLTTGAARFVAWCKILCTYHILKTYNYDYVAYIDCDAFLTLQNSIESIINNNNNNEILFTSNAPFKFKYIEESKYKNVDYTMEVCEKNNFANVPCSGMFIIKNTENTLKFLRDWYLQEPNVASGINERPWDQAGLWDLYVQERYNICIMNNEMFTTKENAINYLKLRDLNSNSKYTDKAIIHCTHKIILTDEFLQLFYPNLTPENIKNTLVRVNYKTFNTDTNNVKDLFNISNNVYIEHFYHNIKGYFTYPELYKQMVEKFDNAVFVEIGCLRGRSATFLAVEVNNLNKNIKIYCVDHWIDTEVYEEFKENIIPVQDYITLIKDKALNAAAQFKDDSLDFVFIDAGHEYEHTKQLLHAWYPKMKKGGVFSGHDYTKNWPGVIKSVDEFSAKKLLTVKVSEDCWLVNV